MMRGWSGLKNPGRPFFFGRPLPLLLLSAIQDTNLWCIPRVLPFVAYLVFLALVEGVAWLKAAPALASLEISRRPLALPFEDDDCSRGASVFLAALCGNSKAGRSGV